ncbi:MAG: shikimate dehydrogenase [Alphaproteobacteria bacterium]
MRETISGRTDVYFMIGHPVTQVRTPSLFNGWAAKNGVDAAMLSLDLAADGIAPFFETLRRTANARGAVVTVPHKQAAFRHLDRALPTPAFVEACNVVRREPDGTLTGAMTDGLGYVTALAANGIALGDADFLLIGAGGAGSAIAYEAARRGVARMVVIDQNAERRETLRRKLAEVFPKLDCPAAIPEKITCDIACNATPVGMAGDPGHPFPLDDLPDGAAVTDVVTDPAKTPWLLAAQDRGMTIQTGIEMVEAQFDLILAELLGGNRQDPG